MTDNIVQSVADAIEATPGAVGFSYRAWVELAAEAAVKATLAALREPSEAMIRAGTIAWRRHNNSDDPYDNEIRDILVAALDASLSTEGNEG